MLGIPDQSHLKSGDIYKVIKPFSTLAAVEYEIGDTLKLIEPTGQTPFKLIADGDVNWFVKCKHFSPPIAESVWSCIQHSINIGLIEKIANGDKK